METLLLELIKTNGISAVILVIGIVWLNGKIIALDAIVKELKVGKTWTETCLEKHKEVDRRFADLEDTRSLLRSLQRQLEDKEPKQ